MHIRDVYFYFIYFFFSFAFLHFKNLTIYITCQLQKPHKREYSKNIYGKKNKKNFFNTKLANMPFFSTKIEATLPKCISCQRMSDKRVKWKILSAYKCGVLYWNWIQRFLNKTFDRNCGVLLKTFVCFFLFFLWMEN